MIQFLLGTWFICSTNFPMWTKGNKTGPTFNYSLYSKPTDNPVLFDEVKYLKNGKQKSIRGYDYPDTQDLSRFTWRGKGLLWIARSKWQVALKDPEGQWAVIHFSKTLFTPEGVDIICRRPHPDKVMLADIKKSMAENTLLKQHISSLKDL